MASKGRVTIDALLNPELPTRPATTSLYAADGASFMTVPYNRQRSSSPPAYQLSPVTWGDRHDARRSTSPSPAHYHYQSYEMATPSSSKHIDHHSYSQYHAKPFEMLVNAAVHTDREMSDHRRAPSIATLDMPHSPASSRGRPASPSTIFDHPYQQSERASVRLAARTTTHSVVYNNYDEEDQLEDDFDNDNAYVDALRPNKRRYPQDGPDLHPPPKKHAAPASYQGPGDVPFDHPMEYGKSSPKSRPTSARPASAKPPKSSEPSSRQNSARPRRSTKKSRQADEVIPGGANRIQSRAAPPQEYRVYKDIKGENGEVVETLTGELQHSRCMSNRYKSDDFHRCLSCTRRWAGDTCRFQCVRVLYRDSTGVLRDVDFVSEPVGDIPQMQYPNKWNKQMEPEHIERVKSVATRGLLDILRREREHLDRPELVRRVRETDCRATCDTCQTSVFAGSWICTSCGREACSDCHDKVVEICNDPEKKQRKLDTTPFFLTCTRKQEHTIDHYRPISRFNRDELDEVIRAMERLDVLRARNIGSSPPSLPPELSPPSDRTSSADSLHPSPGSLVLPLPRGNASHPALGGPASLLALPMIADAQVQDETPRWCHDLPDMANFNLPYRSVRLFHHAELRPAAFRRLWAEGQPLVVEGLLQACRIRWTPEYFIREYGTESCLVIECQTDVNKRVTVEEFFKTFGDYEGRDGCWKLKDWPSSSDFKSVFPSLYEDFMNIVPMPDYARRDGVLNISSHFPANAVGPDLGPKMYNAYASTQDAGSKGSTKLHMDMADAVNIMHFATRRVDGGEGGAVWDIFKSGDSDSIRKFLRSRFRDRHQNGGDPIHDQLHYLDNELLQALHDEYNVASYRVYQRPGDAVFIPAGCAHQVCNLSDCIKVAVDFVSPENIERCELLTREFQAQLWKEDILQLKTMLWYAWLSCSRLEGQPPAPVHPPLPSNNARGLF